MSSPSKSIRAALDRVRELDAEASKGPWEQQADGWTVRQCLESSEDRGPRICSTHPSSAPIHEQVANSEFIAEARTLLPRFAKALEIALEIDQPAGLARDYCSGCGREYAERLLYRIARLLEEETHVG